MYILNLNQKRADDQDIKIVFEHDEGIEKVQVDQIGIERCILNLVNNALDALDSAILERDSGDRLHVQTSLLESGTHWQISVSDNGCGIPEEKLAKVFNAFFSTKGARGTGLGLAVTSKYVHEHCGKISVQSKEGEGTTFIITIPYQYEQN